MTEYEKIEKENEEDEQTYRIIEPVAKQNHVTVTTKTQVEQTLAELKSKVALYEKHLAGLNNA